ncbi:MAG TPA: UDP-N-acetylglucosamine--N-acetylmuramyl-(pentapeptide) pyrophosphoryl-undecaprenol N-acetylglucosamine transferase [Candidatus Avoscillospira avicola]|uniref:UDP-N-acetylglucosamine--N-acetylmuramyl-(pentapeptide) pyrophosphoryl-undecaprenol N-acetylglucosamine transferase n=1 Tax=Candidatus Avoscillospira avicola TaxID=2840706 RepID=A0A9D1IXJ4_9FIRM|nr:UDP-N-acetylglucosamine--N-acetylmuramyl-(pentapeptide) pyrophosphoryl-undecaprenol N-acetylglucosamine transferase [Candidatus Avoscillospira avicola]
MNVIFTCGGTGGHINPAISVANLLRERMPDSKILFIGAEDGMEKNLVPRAGYQLETIRISNFQRKLTPAGIWHNVTTACHMAGSMQKAKKIIRAFQPDVIVGTGGYASYPALHMGAKLGIPTAVHESNAVPGLTTRMVAGHVSRIMVSLADSRSQYPDPEKVTVTGTPVDSAFLYGDREKARAALGIGEEPLIVSAWGSLGAREMNKKIARFMVREAQDGLYRHVHATGSYGWRWMPAYVRDQGLLLENHPWLDMREYIYNMPELLAAADLMLCRAGAGTISEVCASGTPCIMIPSPNVTDNHQEKNARVLEKRGAAVVVREKDCDGDSLYETARELLSDPDRLREMRLAARRLAVVDAAEQILQVIRDLAAGKA